MYRGSTVRQFAKDALITTIKWTIPESVRVYAARALARSSPAVVNAVRCEEYSGTYLERRRFSVGDVRRAIAEAVRRYPAAKVILLSDQTWLSAAGLTVVDDPSEAHLAVGDNVFIVAFRSDERLVGALKKIVQFQSGASEGRRIHWLAPNVALPAANYFDQNDIAYDTLREESALRLGKFDLLDFENLIQASEITRNIEGDYVEIGVYRGDSAHCILNYMQRAKIKRRCWFLDTFEGFNYEEAASSRDRIWQDTHADTSFQYVKDLLSRFDDAHCVKANIISGGLPDDVERIALCNIDVDMYEAVLSALVKVAPKVVPRGIIVLEDPGHTPLLAGARLALHEFLQLEHGRNFMPVCFQSGQTMLVRVAS